MRRVRIVVDAVLAGLFVAVMATALMQEEPHEYLGTIMFVAVAAHVALNRRWFKALARGRYNAVRMLRLVMIVGLSYWSRTRCSQVWLIACANGRFDFR